MNQLSSEIEYMIKKEAQRGAIEGGQWDTYQDGHYDGYQEGATKWASDMIPFAKFYEENKWRKYAAKISERLTDEGILTLFIQTKNS